MRPNTPHAVYTPENSICHGGHFFASTTLKDTFSGIVHSFMADAYITNNSPKHSRYALRRIIIFYHYALVREMIEVDGMYLKLHLIIFVFDIFVYPFLLFFFRFYTALDPAHNHIPDLKTMDSVVDVIMACVIGIFTNLLDFETYLFPIPEHTISDEERQQFEQDDFNAMTKIDRMACTYVRGLSWSLLEWLTKNIIVLKNDQDFDLGNMIETYILDLCLALWTYKSRAQAQSVNGVPGCNLESLERQLKRLFMEESPLCSRLQDELGTEREALNFDTIGYTVQRRETARMDEDHFSVHSMIKRGLNPADVLYYTSIYGDIDEMLEDITLINGSKQLMYISLAVIDK